VKRKKKTYIVAITKTFKITGLIHYETIAKNAKEAVKEAKKEYKKNASEWDKDMLSDALDIRDYDGAQCKISSAGPASDYHSENECKLCQKVSGK